MRTQPGEVTLKCIVSLKEDCYDVVIVDFLTIHGKPLRGFGIPNPVLMPIEIFECCGFFPSSKDDKPQKEKP